MPMKKEFITARGSSSLRHYPIRANRISVLLPNIPDFPRLPSYFQSRTEAASALPMRIVCYVKEYIEVPQRCLIFDENTGVPRPIKPGEGFDFQYGLVMEVQPSPIQS